MTDTTRTSEEPPEPDVGGDRRTRAVILRRSAITVLVGVVVVYAAVGWYLSNRIIDGGLTSRPHVVTYDTDVLSVTGTEIELGLPDESNIEADRDAVMGLRWDGGYAQLGPATAWTETTEIRPFALLFGQMPPVGEDVADFDSFAFAPDPSALGVEFDTVRFSSDFGEFEAWLVPGERSTWIIAVHGQDSDRTEFLRLIDATRALGYPILAVRYRNSVDSPSTDGNRILLGQEEWRDVEGAVDYALANGASGVVVYGASMGGAVSLAYTLNETRDVIDGLILESPLADIREAISIRSGEALPVGGPIGESLLAAGRLVASVRTGIDFDSVDYVERADELDVPVLLFHGTDDTKMPFEVGEALAGARPDLIEFHAVSDAYHVRAWNEDPDGFELTVSAFLARIGR